SLEGSVPIDDRCWIFTHLQKCGGTTVKGILEASFTNQYDIYDSPHWKRGNRNLQTVGSKLAGSNALKVIAGGYPEALRYSSAVAEKCQWFTMFRHPIPRMVSAYYYCMKSQGDAACGSMIVKAKEVDLVTFAKHWGNFALRQFALGLVPVDDVLQYARTDAVRAQVPSMSEVSGWYLLKMYLDDQARASEHVEIPDVSMYEMLQPVQDLLRDRYTVGILEEFNTTLSLFDATLKLPGVDWHKQFTSEGRLQVDTQYLDEEAASLADAWTNSEIKKYMALDLVLYEHAVDVFHQQARAYGL
ncbi:unnamed protein product, partial [Laminaria digitata]